MQNEGAHRFLVVDFFNQRNTQDRGFTQLICILQQQQQQQKSILLPIYSWASKGNMSGLRSQLVSAVVAKQKKETVNAGLRMLKTFVTLSMQGMVK